MVRIREERHGAVVVLVPSGGMDLTNLPAFERRLDALQGEGARAILWDLGEVEILPSAAIGFLMQAARRLRARGGHMAIARASRLARATLSTMGILDVFALYERREDGIADLGARIP